MNLFIDTNVFLSFFHLSSDDLEELHKLTVLIEKGEVKLWLPEQVDDEFSRNRENKLADSMKRLAEQKKKPQFPQVCKDYEEYDEIRELQELFGKKLSSLIDKVASDVSERTLKADEKIEELFGQTEFIKTSEGLLRKARRRMDIGNPPGKNGSFGDAINWEALLEHIPKKEDLYVVADDKDYYSLLDEQKPKDFLVDEWFAEKNSDVIFYRRLSQFFKEHYPDIKLASELEKELAIRALAESGSFAATHVAIANLSSYTEFTQAQISEIVEAALTNNQVSWILCDPDVRQFFSALLDSHGDIMKEGERAEIESELLECPPTDDIEDA
ncbi:PIN domain-containing protein [Thiohalomonas denitrificans]|uniref:PIN domain-containing protein n=1 Tax=Thiohalomonas denitrificans TaxID=415747 RepID=UPI0026ED2227|nr:PIN domain-containing protein [Thiohalomonas denitrificans]